MFTADMAVQNFCGLGMRGATWVALHNGGGTGWGEAINGGFGYVLDGRDQYVHPSSFSICLVQVDENSFVVV